MSAVTLAELSVDPLAARSDVERQSVLQQVEAHFHPIPFDDRAARAFGRVAAQLCASGRKTTAPAYDVLIAATAVANDLPLFTRSPDDFAGIESLNRSRASGSVVGDCDNAGAAGRPGVRQLPVSAPAGVAAGSVVGDDTDTVAASAGALLGARWGASAVPAAWRRRVHGWPGMRANGAVRLGVLAARGGRDDPQGWPSVEHFDYSGYGDLSKPIPHPADDGVLLGAAGYVHEPPQDHVEVWLIDSPDPEANPNLEFVIDDAE
ncbi:MAG: hypothetical protein LH616_13435, partial [Ilumatobacteraceae bacterium]|nr:hypothetical protein [Ilumatobacteraceae bacterium]